jgi:hypothetical protein
MQSKPPVGSSKRPVTAIQEGENDGNTATAGDPSWQPFLNTPPYPDYTSGANGVTGALTRSLALFFGKEDMIFTVTSDYPQAVQKTRTYARFSDMASGYGQCSNLPRHPFPFLRMKRLASSAQRWPTGSSDTSRPLDDPTSPCIGTDQRVSPPTLSITASTAGRVRDGSAGKSPRCGLRVHADDLVCLRLVAGDRVPPLFHQRLDQLGARRLVLDQHDIRCERRALLAHGPLQLGIFRAPAQYMQ